MRPRRRTTLRLVLLISLVSTTTYCCDTLGTGIVVGTVLSFGGVSDIYAFGVASLSSHKQQQRPRTRKHTTNHHIFPHSRRITMRIKFGYDDKNSNDAQPDVYLPKVPPFWSSEKLRESTRSSMPSLKQFNNSNTDPAFISPRTSSLVYKKLSTLGREDIESCPNSGNFFYNDEVMSHLQGYMYLIGFFGGQDGLFVASFFIWNSIGAYMTQSSFLPANPRVPAIIAVMTFVTTAVFRNGLAWDPVTDFFTTALPDYGGPADPAWMYELGICALNIGWGLLGTWRTKQPALDGATYGF